MLASKARSVTRTRRLYWLGDIPSRSRAFSGTDA
jgi:hypothetical protein